MAAMASLQSIMTPTSHKCHGVFPNYAVALLTWSYPLPLALPPSFILHGQLRILLSEMKQTRHTIITHPDRLTGSLIKICRTAKSGKRWKQWSGLLIHHRTLAA